MKHRRLLGIFLLITLVPAMPSGSIAAEAARENPSPTAVKAKPLPDLQLADLIPRTAELSIRLADLKQELAAGADLSVVENDVTELAANLAQKSAQLQRLKDSQSSDPYSRVGA